MDFAGLNWRRLQKGMDKDTIYHEIASSVDVGIPVLLKLGKGPDWHVVTGYDGLTLYGLDSHTHYMERVRPQVKPDRYTEDGLFELSNWVEPFEDAIIITGRCKPTATLSDVLGRIIHILEHPANAKLEADIMRRIDEITPDNAGETARWLNGMAGFPIEARWHAAEAFASAESAACGIMRMTDNEGVRKKLGQIFFSYIADNSDETHGVCWKIWGLLGVGPETGYALPANAEELVIRPENRAELKRLFSLVFHNDRTVLKAMREASELIGETKTALNE